MNKKNKSGIPGIIPPNSLDLLPEPIETVPTENKNRTTTTGEPKEARQNIRRYNRRMLKR